MLGKPKVTTRICKEKKLPASLTVHLYLLLHLPQKISDIFSFPFPPLCIYTLWSPMPFFIKIVPVATTLTPCHGHLHQISNNPHLLSPFLETDNLCCLPPSAPLSSSPSSSYLELPFTPKVPVLIQYDTGAGVESKWELMPTGR